MRYMTRVATVIFIIGVMSVQSLFGQQKVSLSVDQAIDLALKNNKQYKQAEADLEKSNYQINEAWGYAMPTITGNIQYTRTLKPNVFFITQTDSSGKSRINKLQIGADNAYTMGISINQALFSKTVGTALEVAEIYEDYSSEGLRSSKLATIFNTKKAYYSALLAKSFYNDAKKIYDLTEANYNNVHEMYKNGMASEFDELRLSVQLSNTAPKVLQAENSFKLALLNLKNTIGADANSELELSDEFKLTQVGADQTSNASEISIDNNATIKQLEIQKSLLDKNTEITEAGFWPSLYAFGSFSRQTQANNFDFGSYSWVNSASVGLQLSIPIFSGLQTYWKVEQNKVDARKLDYQIDYLKDNLKLSANQAALKLSESKKRVDAQEKSVGQAEKALSIAEARFKNGVGLQLEILDAQVALSQTLTNRSQAIYDYLIAKAEWEQAVGLE